MYSDKPIGVLRHSINQLTDVYLSRDGKQLSGRRHRQRRGRKLPPTVSAIARLTRFRRASQKGRDWILEK